MSASPGPDPYGFYPSSPSYPVEPAASPAVGEPTSPLAPVVPGPGLLPDPYPPTSGFAPISSPLEPMWAPYPSPPKHRSKGIKAAYWPSFDDFPASSIDTSYFTHIYYAFILPEPATFKLNVTQLDLTKIPELIDTLRAKNLPIKILLSIGGGGNDPDVFSKMATTKETRATFINSTIEIARKYGFDGVDLDWEFPANDQDMSNLGLLFRQWRKALNHEARTSRNSRLLLTAAVYYASKFTTYGEPRSYPADAVKNYVDWVSPMCFDYHGSWENFTGIQAALYDPNSNISTSYGIGSWVQAGVPPEMLVMGLPLYGRTWKLKDPNVNGIGAPALGVGPGAGILTFNQIVDFNTANSSTVRFDDEKVGYYSYAGDSWIGYDDVESVKRKVRFAKSRGLGGYFFWALGQDKDWTISRQASNSWRR
ncbi:hypothetical protein Pint_12484 [Pistacia integerrima]|uniref:Uncharacterized protein n=1 Tax=Pistacia integerrima TaxID=434235 RepID=A0ACC0Y6F0_9ROSI|nr:hypothetical protein Pint_12484 [Pistacia integerrima]